MIRPSVSVCIRARSPRGSLRHSPMRPSATCFPQRWPRSNCFLFWQSWMRPAAENILIGPVRKSPPRSFWPPTIRNMTDPEARHLSSFQTETGYSTPSPLSMTLSPFSVSGSPFFLCMAITTPESAIIAIRFGNAMEALARSPNSQTKPTLARAP